MKVVIIGGGIGGLATANLFAKSGHEVHVFEQNDQLGGRAGQFTDSGFTFDTGPSWYLMPEVFDHYYELLGTSTHDELDLIKLSPAYKIYSGDQPITITGELKKDAATFEAIEKGAGKKLERYVARSSITYQLALQHFLYNDFTSLRDFAKVKLLRYGARMSRLATQSMHQYVKTYFSNLRLQQVLEYPAVFLGSSPYSAPALYSLMSALDFDEGVFYPKGTMYAVVESLIKYGKQFGVTYHTSMEVKKIVTEDKVAQGILLSDDSFVAADVVIANSDLHFTETQLLAKQDQSFTDSFWKKREPSPSALLMYIGVDKKIPEFEHHTLLFTKDWAENFNAIFKEKRIPSPASLYISKTSQSDATAPKGKENIFILVPLPAGISLTHDEAETLADTYLGQIKQTTGVDIKKHTITRTLFGPDDFSNKYKSWQGSMLGLSHILSQSAFYRPSNKSKKLKNLYYVGANTIPGVGVPMCLISAELAYNRILKDHLR